MKNNMKDKIKVTYGVVIIKVECPLSNSLYIRRASCHWQWVCFINFNLNTIFDIKLLFEFYLECFFLEYSIRNWRCEEHTRARKRPKIIIL